MMHHGQSMNIDDDETILYLLILQLFCANSGYRLVLYTRKALEITIIHFAKSGKYATKSQH